MQNQRTGVYNAIVAFCDENNVAFEDGMEFVPTKEQRTEIIALVAAAFEAEEITMSEEAKEKYNNLAKLKSYSNGLVSNWLRKDPRLNGNVKHEIKNPGSRAGSGDPVIKELRKLKKTLTSGSAEFTAVDQEINKRLEKVQAEKAKKVTIDVDQIPEELRHLIPTA